MASLNPKAAPFQPSSSAPSSPGTSPPVDTMMQQMRLEEANEEHLTAQELEELEACEEWNAMMADLEEEEADHLIELALRCAPLEQLEKIHTRYYLAAEQQQEH